MEQYCVSDVDVTLIRVYSTEDTIAEKERRKEERKRERENRCSGLCNKKKIIIIR